MLYICLNNDKNYPKRNTSYMMRDGGAIHTYDDKNSLSSSYKVCKTPRVKHTSRCTTYIELTLRCAWMGQLQTRTQLYKFSPEKVVHHIASDEFTHNTHTHLSYIYKHSQAWTTAERRSESADRRDARRSLAHSVYVCENVWVRECMKPTYGNRLHYYISASQSGHRSTVGRIFWGSLSIMRADFPFNAIFLLNTFVVVCVVQ